MLKLVALASALGACYIALPAEASREDQLAEDEEEQRVAPFEGVKKDIQEKLSQAARKLVESSVNQAELTKKVASNIAQYHSHVKNIGSTMGRVMKARSALTKAYHEDLKRGEETRVGALEVNLPEVLGEDYSLPNGDFSGSQAGSSASEEEQPEAQQAGSPVSAEERPEALQARAPASEEEAASLDALESPASDEEEASASEADAREMAEVNDAALSEVNDNVEEQRELTGERPLTPSQDEDGVASDNGAVTDDVEANDVVEEQAHDVEASNDAPVIDDTAANERAEASSDGTDEEDWAQEDPERSSFAQVGTNSQDEDKADDDTADEDKVAVDEESEDDTGDDDKASPHAQTQAVKYISRVVKRQHVARQQQPQRQSRKHNLHRSRLLPRSRIAAEAHSALLESRARPRQVPHAHLPHAHRKDFGLAGDAKGRAFQHGGRLELLNKLTPQHPHRVKARRMAHVASHKRLQKTSMAVHPRSFTVDRRWAKHHSSRSKSP